MSGSQLFRNNVAPLNQSQGRSNLAQRVFPKQQNWRQHRRPAVQSAACSTQVTEGEAVVGSGRAAPGQAQVSVTAKPLHSAPSACLQPQAGSKAQGYSERAFLPSWIPEARGQAAGPWPDRHTRAADHDRLRDGHRTFRLHFPSTPLAPGPCLALVWNSNRVKPLP